MKLTYISKEQSLILKGFALLLMVFLHLFNNQANLKEAFSLCSVQGVPLANWLSRGCSPVGLYLFVSGYGLYFSHKLSKRGGYLRIVKLYKLYWLTLAVFLPIACWLRPEQYPGNWTHWVGSITAFRTYWNGEAWFLFPYILLVLTSKYVFLLLDKLGSMAMMAGSYALTFISMFLISRYYSSYFDDHYAAYQVVLYFDCLFMFVMGAVFCKCADREFGGRAARLLSLPQWVLMALFLLVFISQCIINFTPYSGLCQLVLIALFLRINWSGMAKKALQMFGRYSTVVWLIHTWICYYCFKPFIYSLHYPLLMLAVTMACSIAIGYVILRVDRWTNRILHLKGKRN